MINPNIVVNLDKSFFSPKQILPWKRTYLRAIFLFSHVLLWLLSMVKPKLKSFSLFSENFEKPKYFKFQLNSDTIPPHGVISLLVKDRSNFKRLFSLTLCIRNLATKLMLFSIAESGLKMSITPKIFNVIKLLASSNNIKIETRQEKKSKYIALSASHNGGKWFVLQFAFNPNYKIKIS